MSDLLDARPDDFSDLVTDTEPPRRCRRISIVCPDSPVDAACFAAALAVYLARVNRGRSDHDHEGPGVVLVDRQPGCGGLDVITDLEAQPGARWGAMRGAGSHIDGLRLLGALPSRDGVAVLSHGRRALDLSVGVQTATLDALAEFAGAIVTAVGPMGVVGQEADCVVVLVRGSVAALAGAEQLVHAMTGDQPVGLVALETGHEARAVMAEALGVPVVAAAPTRWRLGAHCADHMRDGRWPGAGDRTMERLVREVSMFAADADRSVSWA